MAPAAVPMLHRETQGKGSLVNIAELLNGDISYLGEVDYYEPYLQAGNYYTIDMRASGSGSGTLSDTFVSAFDPFGNHLGSDDDSGEGLDSKFTFYASVSGYYQIHAEAYEGGDVGSYQISVSPSQRSAFGTSGGDALSGTAAGETIYALDGDDTVYGYGGADHLLGGNGHDLIEPGTGNDTVHGGNDVDKVSYYNDPGTAGVTIDLRLDVAHRGGETDRLHEIEDADGTRNADLIDGDDAANNLGGADGNDTVRAWWGDDTVRGGTGNDLLEPGFGFDSVHGGPGTDKVSYYNDGGSQGVVVDLTAGTARRGGHEVDHLHDVENADGTNNLDTLRGNGLANELGGANGNDLLHGRAGNDLLRGGNGNDRLVGEQGRDTLTGGTNNDVLDFDRTTDSPWSSGKTTCDVIADFTHLGDRIDLSTIDARSATAANDAFSFLAAKGAAFTAAGQARWYQSGGNTFVEASNDADSTAELQIQLTGLKTLTAADFIL
jgi:Ca2+-binding RTX toxin-like protein